MRRKVSWQLWYTFFFLCTAAGVAVIFLILGKSPLRMIDGVYQCVPVFAHQRALLRSVLSGRGLETLSFSLGQGLDIFPSLASLDLCNPLSLLLTLIIPSGECVYILYILISMYLAGLFFGFFCAQYAAPGAEWHVTAAAALLYVFTGYCPDAAFHHIWFLNGPLYLALMLTASERLLRGNRWGLFTAGTALMFLADYYFAFKTSLLTALYLLVRLALEGGSARGFFGGVWRALRAWALGVMLSAAALLPVAMAYLDNARLGLTSGYGGSLWHYPPKYYLRLVCDLVQPYSVPGYSTVVSLSVPALFAAGLLFAPRGQEMHGIPRGQARVMRASLLLCAVLLCVPVFGKLFNAWGYVTNRFSYVLAATSGAALAAALPALTEPGRRTLRTVSVLAAAAAALVTAASLLTGGSAVRRAAYVAPSLALLLAGWLFVRLRAGRPSRRLPGSRGGFMALTVLLCVACTGRVLLFHADSMLPPGEAERMAADTALPAELADGGGFSRVDTGADVDNFAGIGGYRGLGFYWSVIPSWISRHYQALEVPSLTYTFCLQGQGGGTLTQAAAAVRFASRPRGEAAVVPYGFEEIPGAGGGRVLYRNRYDTGAGRVYAQRLSLAEYGALDPLEKQQALLRYAVTDGGPLESSAFSGSAAVPAAWSVLACEDAELTDGSITARKGGSIRLAVEGLPDAETWLRIAAPVLTGGEGPAVEFRTHTEAGWSLAAIGAPDSAFSYPQSGLTVALGYSETGIREVLLTFEADCSFRFDQIGCWSLPMSLYREVMESGMPLLENVEAGNGRLSGTVDAPAGGILQLSVPFQRGWRARVDGQPVPVFLCGGMYTGLSLEPGEHRIELTYHTPGLRAGLWVTAAGLVLTGLAFLSGRAGKRRRA